MAAPHCKSTARCSSRSWVGGRQAMATERGVITNPVGGNVVLSPLRATSLTGSLFHPYINPLTVVSSGGRSSRFAMALRLADAQDTSRGCVTPGRNGVSYGATIFSRVGVVPGEIPGMDQGVVSIGYEKRPQHQPVTNSSFGTGDGAVIRFGEDHPAGVGTRGSQRWSVNLGVSGVRTETNTDFCRWTTAITPVDHAGVFFYGSRTLSNAVMRCNSGRHGSPGSSRGVLLEHNDSQRHEAMSTKTNVYPHTIRLPLDVHQRLTDAADALGMQPAVLARLLIIQGLESATIRLPARDRVRRCA